MTAYAVRTFNGMAPLVAPHLLDQGQAQSSLNTKLYRGDLRPWKDTANVISLPAGTPPQTIYRYGEGQTVDTQFWFTWPTDVNVVRGPIADDQFERVYWTGDTVGGADYPKYTINSIATGGSPYPTTRRRLGVPSPDAAPTTAVSGTATDVNSLPITCVYAVTFVTDVGEEGPPSALSAETSFRLGQTVTVTMPVSVPGTFSGVNGVTKKRLYRSATGTSATALQFVGEYTLATGSATDNKKQTELGEVIPSRSWQPPPTAMRGLCLGANGVLAGFFGNTVCFSESFLPHAWPPEFQQATEFPIVALGAFGNSWIVATTGNPYIMTGTDGSSVSSTKVDMKQACVSKRSLVEVEGGVIYASPDGLVLASPGGVDVITRGILGREQWQAYVPSSIKAFQYDGRYHAVYDTGSKKGMLVFDFTGGGATLTEVDIAPYTVNGGAYDILRDGLYLSVTDGSNNNSIRRFDFGAGFLPYTWRSKLYVSPRGINLACAMVDSDFESGNVTFKLYADGVLKHTQAVTSREPFWLPSGYMAITHYIEVSGSSAVRGVSIGESLDEVVKAMQ